LCAMGRRGLVAAVLCGLIGLAGGVLVAWLVQPRPAHGGLADPVPAVSPSVPVDVPTESPYAEDIGYPSLSPDLAVPVRHRIANQLAVWQYHVPLGWAAYSVCTPGQGEVCALPDDTPLTSKQIEQADQVRFRPPDEPLVGGYSLRVRILNNTLNNLQQMVATKLVGFQQGVKDFRTIRRTPSGIYFSYRDPTTNFHRYNYFQWFAVPGQTNATLEMSVSGRQQDVPGLKALFNRFADNVSGSLPKSPEKAPKSPASSGPASTSASPSA
jgi:hypothetical protein